MAVRRFIYSVGNKTETGLNRLKLLFRQRMGLYTPLQVIPYMTYGTWNEIYIKGRVLHDKGIEINKFDTRRKNLLNSYKRISSTPIAGVEMKLSLSNTVHIFTSGNDGYFEFRLPLNNPLPAEELWHNPVIEVLHSPVKLNAPMIAHAQVMTPPATAHFGVISDIDDTILTTHATNLLRMAYVSFFKNAHARMPFKGVAAFYRALQAGIASANFNPVFYVSSSPWNLYDLLVDFMELNDIPQGPLLLKDYGFSDNKLFRESHHVHKPKQIRNILNTYPKLNFILIGDSGQRDPEVYEEVVKEFPGRILAVYIRDVTLEKRDLQVERISEGMRAQNVEFVYSEDSYTAALHASEKGFINPDFLPEINEERKLDEEGVEMGESDEDESEA